MALDGLELVLSRTSILDIILMFWILAAAFGLLVIDRDQTRARLEAAVCGRRARRRRRPAPGHPLAARRRYQAWAPPAPPSGTGSGT